MKQFYSLKTLSLRVYYAFFCHSSLLVSFYIPFRTDIEKKSYNIWVVIKINQVTFNNCIF